MPNTYIPAERDSTYPAPPSRVQLERTRGADPEEDLDNSPGHRRSYSVPADRLQVGQIKYLCFIDMYTTHLLYAANRFRGGVYRSNQAVVWFVSFVSMSLCSKFLPQCLTDIEKYKIIMGSFSQTSSYCVVNRT